MELWKMDRITKIIIGLAIAMVVPLVFVAAYTFTPRCSVGEYYIPYNQENLESGTTTSEMILIGTVKNVEVKVFDLVMRSGEFHSGDIPRAHAVEKALYKFVTLDVQKYLVDRTGKYSKEVTVRSFANECVDAFGNFSPMERDHYVKYGIGEKVLLFVAEEYKGTLYQSLYTFKFDIIDGKVQGNEATGIPPMNLADLENKIIDILSKQNGNYIKQSLNPDEELIMRTRELEEVKAFLNKYPVATIDVDRSGRLAVDYRVDKPADDNNGALTGKYLRLRVFFDDGKPQEMYVDCSDGKNAHLIYGDILNYIETETCLK